MQILRPQNDCCANLAEVPPCNFLCSRALACWPVSCSILSTMHAHFGRYTLALAILSAGGCTAGAIAGAAQGGQPYMLQDNALSLNGLVSNGLLPNGLALNGARMNGVSLNGLALNHFSLNGLSQSESIWIMSYIVSCALPAGHSITFRVS